MLVVERTGVTVALVLEAASTRWQRVKGLLGRSALSADGGLLIQPCRGVHTWFMQFAIDVVFIDRNQRVVRLVHRLAPFRTASGGRQAHAVIELPAGRAAASGLVEGDRLQFAPTAGPDRAGIR